MSSFNFCFGSTAIFWGFSCTFLGSLGLLFWPSGAIFMGSGNTALAFVFNSAKFGTFFCTVWAFWAIFGVGHICEKKKLVGHGTQTRPC